MPPPRLLARRSFDAAMLVRQHPPRFTDGNKRAAHEVLVRQGETASGTLELTRWDAAELPASRTPGRGLLTERPGYFQYGQPSLPPGTRHWHVNFANDDCFLYYGGPLLAQDELQVLEHPVLASLREAASTGSFSLVCRADRPTPVLVAGAERRGALDTQPAPGRLGGLYGNAFARAPVGAVKAALTRIEPPTRTNLLAIEAPKGGTGPYSRETVAHVLTTAYTGFAAARAETVRAAHGAPARCVIHTGFWGAGAYGGDRELMALLQLVAAELAGVDEVVFYTVESGAPELGRARQRLAKLARVGGTAQVLDEVAAAGFRWGRPNGT